MHACYSIAGGGDVLHFPNAQLRPFLLGRLHESLGQLLGMDLGGVALIPHRLHQVTHPHRSSAVIGASCTTSCRWVGLWYRHNGIANDVSMRA